MNHTASPWSVADCPSCRAYVVWPNHPLGGGTRYFCSYGPVVEGTSKKIELCKLTECPNGGIIPKEQHSQSSEVGKCPACGKSQWWVSIDNAHVCEICHPPASPKLVKEWVNENQEGKINE